MSLTFCRLSLLAGLALLASPAPAYVVGAESAPPDPFAAASAQGQLDAAYTALRNGRIEQAEKIFIEANRTNPRAYEPLLGLAMVAQARERPQHAREWMARAVSAAPGEPRLLQAQSRLLLEQGLAEQAVDSYHKAIAANPLSPQLRYDLASLLLDRLKRPAEALAVITELLVRKPEMAAAYVKLAQAQRALGKPEEAARALDEAARRDPAEAQVPLLQANLSLEQGKAERALAYADKALALRPESVEALIERANALAALNRVEDALAAYRRAATLAPASAVPHVMQGRLLERQKRYPEAEAAYRGALLAQPGQAVAMNNLAALLAARGGKLDEAAELAARAVRSDPQRAGFVDTLGLVQQAQGKNAEARQSFERALQLDPANATYRQHLAQLAPSSAPLASVPKPPALPPAPAPAAIAVAPVAATPAVAAPVAAAPAPARAVTEEDPARLLGPTLEAWRKAWEQKDVEAYLGHYGRDFVPADKRSRTAWEAERRAKLGKPGPIEVRIDRPVYMLSGNVLSVVFEQNYKSANYSDVVRKQIEWVRDNGSWRIRREFTR